MTFYYCENLDDVILNVLLLIAIVIRFWKCKSRENLSQRNFSLKNVSCLAEDEDFGGIELPVEDEANVPLDEPANPVPQDWPPPPPPLMQDI